jgi:hypothetical protein
MLAKAVMAARAMSTVIVGMSSWTRSNGPRSFIEDLRLASARAFGISLGLTFGVGLSHGHREDRSGDLADVRLVAQLGANSQSPLFATARSSALVSSPPAAAVGRILVDICIIRTDCGHD